MATTNLQLITGSYQECGVVDETQAPTAEQGVTALEVLNDMMANLSADGVRLGWYPQGNLANNAPLQSQDVEPVKLLLAVRLCCRYGIAPSEVLVSLAVSARTRLEKRALLTGEADMSELPRSQGPRGNNSGFGGRS